MSTVDRPRSRIPCPFEDGQRLDQPTFHRLYATMPDETRAELVGGVVQVAFPLFEEHGIGDFDLGGWLFHYQRFTTGVRGASNVSTILDDASEVQPDLQLRSRDDRGGMARVVDGYVVGPPELVIEVGHSSRPFDLGPKKDAYEAAGVLEYLFVGIEPQEVRWFVRRDGRFVLLNPGDDGIYRSEVFPGLWLDPVALFAEDLNGLVVTLEQGLASHEHTAFAARLADRG